MADLSVDIETLDTAASAVVLTLGAVIFDPASGVEFDSFEMSFTMEDQIATNRTVDAGTIRWWLGQSDAARQALLKSPSVEFRAGLAAFVRWAGRYKIERAWARGQDFDMGILRHAAAQSGLTLPWDFWRNRDVRTLVDDLLPKDLHPTREGTHHAGLADARYQARGVIATERYLQNLRLSAAMAQPAAEVAHG